MLPTHLLEVNLNANIVNCIKGKRMLKCKLVFCVLLLLLMLLDIDSNIDLTIINYSYNMLAQCSFLGDKKYHQYFLTARYLPVCNFSYLLSYNDQLS